MRSMTPKFLVFIQSIKQGCLKIEEEKNPEIFQLTAGQNNFHKIREKSFLINVVSIGLKFICWVCATLNL